MPKKRGFRGTPVKPSGFGSVGRVFDNRGDPMVTAREGRERYGRNLDTENPDFDRYFAENRQRAEAANKALKASQIDKGNAFRKSIAKKADVQTRAVNTLLKMEREMRKGTVKVPSNSGKPHVVKGGFYYFPDQTDKLQDEPKHPPRPFFGIGQSKGKKEK